MYVCMYVYVQVIFGLCFLYFLVPSNVRQPSPPRNRRLSPGALNSDRSRLQTHHRSRSPQGGSIFTCPH